MDKGAGNFFWEKLLKAYSAGYSADYSAVLKDVF
jgi:hypothetical protein